MSETHARPDRVVWFDLPVANLARASAFYAAVLGIKVEAVNAGNFKFAVLEHGADGNGGCVGILVYGGKVLKAPGNIGPHGFRAIVLDSEGNRVALHSSSDG